VWRCAGLQRTPREWSFLCTVTAHTLCLSTCSDRYDATCRSSRRCGNSISRDSSVGAAGTGATAVAHAAAASAISSALYPDSHMMHAMLGRAAAAASNLLCCPNFVAAAVPASPASLEHWTASHPSSSRLAAACSSNFCEAPLCCIFCASLQGVGNWKTYAGSWVLCCQHLKQLCCISHCCTAQQSKATHLAAVCCILLTSAAVVIHAAY
jgi:hypothetical protein